MQWPTDARQVRRKSTRPGFSATRKSRAATLDAGNRGSAVGPGHPSQHRACREALPQSKPASQQQPAGAAGHSQCPSSCPLITPATKTSSPHSQPLSLLLGTEVFTSSTSELAQLEPFTQHWLSFFTLTLPGLLPRQRAESDSEDKQPGTGRFLFPCAGDRFYHPASPDRHMQPYSHAQTNQPCPKLHTLSKSSRRNSGRLFCQSQAVGRVLTHRGPKDRDFG